MKSKKNGTYVVSLYNLIGVRFKYTEKDMDLILLYHDDLCFFEFRLKDGYEGSFPEERGLSIWFSSDNCYIKDKTTMFEGAGYDFYKIN